MAKITIDPDRLLTLAAAAARLRISRQAVARAINERRLRSIRIGGLPFVSIEEIENYQPAEGNIRSGKKRAASKKKR